MRRFLVPKRHADGRTLLNLGCGTRTHPGWNNVDFSPYARLVRYRRMTAFAYRARLIAPERYERLRRLEPDMVHRDLRRGIPYPDGSLDAVYHSHFLEHMDRGDAETLLRECRRVLRPGGVLRVVVPDLRLLVDRYVATSSELDVMGPGDGVLERHEAAIQELFGQMVIRQYTGRRGRQHPLVRWIEATIRGDAASVGELHRWMYDRHTLRALLERLGFADVREERADTSRIAGWAAFHLDTEPDGALYKPESLFMEAARPGAGRVGPMSGMTAAGASATERRNGEI